MISSKSRSRRTGWCSSPSARWRPISFGANSRRCANGPARNDRIVGGSPAVHQLQQIIARVAPVNSRVLITGAPGSGKELAARCIHEASSRAGGPFVVINSATITPENMEIELFGREGVDGEPQGRRARGGAWRHAVPRRNRRHAQGHPGKILRVLVDQTFLRVGGSTRVQVDVRIISSSARDLAVADRGGGLREDLFHRLAVVPIRVPSLAERREDIPELIEYFMESMSLASGMPRRRIAEDALAVLQSHDWPGNIRQLRNNVERLMILTAGDAERRRSPPKCCRPTSANSFRRRPPACAAKN